MATIYAIIDYDDAYVRPLIIDALEKHLPPGTYTVVSSAQDAPPGSSTVQISDYEALDFTRLANPNSLINAYVIRKALIRKHYLSNTISTWVTKNPSSQLKHHVKPAVEIELDYAEFLDEALVEAYELRESFERNEDRPQNEQEWWILKPGMSDRGQGIRLFSTEKELTSIFEEWDPESDEDDDEDADARSDANADSNTDGIMTSQLRHFVAQPYIHPPLLLSPASPSPTSSTRRKFHIRTYVLAIGALKVYVYRPMLALFAAQDYTPPWQVKNLDGLRAHLTNTCLQDTEQREGSVCAFWDLPADLPNAVGWKENVFKQICDATGELFEAAARGQMVHFQPLPNAFEVYGLDFMVDEDLKTWLLEVNAYPDFKQTGEELSGLVSGLWEQVVEVAVKPHLGLGEVRKNSQDMIQVLNIDLGRR